MSVSPMFTASSSAPPPQPHAPGVGASPPAAGHAPGGTVPWVAELDGVHHGGASQPIIAIGGDMNNKDGEQVQLKTKLCESTQDSYGWILFGPDKVELNLVFVKDKRTLNRFY